MAFACGCEGTDRCLTFGFLNVSASCPSAQFATISGTGAVVVSDIFISYAREDRALAEALASDLKSRGYNVWWDTELVGSDNFQDVILAALAKARAAIVIWTKASVKSLFVRDEARYALHYKKLVAVKQPDVDVLEIPFGFQSQHTDDVHDRNQIFRAVTKLGVASASPRSPVDDTWESIRSSRDADAVLAWLEANPTHEKRLEAFQRVRSLIEAEDTRTAAEETPHTVARTSYLSAFLSGLTFRVPSFQLSTQGKWSAIGQAIGLVVLLLVGAFFAIGVAKFLFPQEAIAGFATIGLLWLSLLWLALRSFGSLVNQRLFVGAWIVSPMILLLSVATALVAAAVTVIGLGLLGWTEQGHAVTIIGAAWILVAGLIVPIVYMVWKARSVR